ncbi:phosphatidate cytidylyltransferase [Pararobbsia silviterrae]|uniref:Phosphatidate cytidylyltransferase n=1 Tax=Pararobbsia silviterrae TaxID=1792498 RepID=A0A494Y2H8_9BURK|nr:phosphatidate cytidylyltransferase [Pararobbsia silviterrae]RKP54657.1 phosphatidate cytidylyltransferase [Pararobbsia silviterrae]
MLKTRVITAVILLAVLVPVTLFAPIAAFGALIAFIVVFAAWEWARLLKVTGLGPVLYAGVTGAVLVATTSRFGLAIPGLYLAAAIFWVLVSPFALVRKPVLAEGAWRTFLLLAGIVVLLAAWHALVQARTIGVRFVLTLLLIVWIADVGAYFAGKALGRHKLAPSISPGKTWEGAIGGLALVLVVAVALQVTHAAQPNYFTVDAAVYGTARMLVWVACLVAFSVLGDLFESLLKRQAGVKDSSHLLPGHGGVLDRIDAMLPVLPLAMLLLT